MDRLKGFFKRLFASAEDVAASEERSVASRQVAVTLIENASDRQKSSFSGVVRSVVFNPELAQARLEVELYDGTGALSLVWLGRREVAGIVPGARLTATGMVTMVKGRPALYNPAYVLKARTGEA